MDGELVSALIADKAISLALLVLGIGIVWRRYTTQGDKLIAALTGKLDAVVAKVGDVEAAVKLGLAGVAGKLDEHHRRITEAERRLDRHSDLLRALPDRSGVYPVPRPRVVGEEADR